MTATVAPVQVREVTSLRGSALFLVLAKGFQLGAGYLFWIVAARLASVASIGSVAAAVSGVMLCTQIALLGMGAAMIVAIGRGASPARVLDGGLTVVAAASGAVALSFLAVGRLLGGSTGADRVAPAFAVAFLVAAIAGTVMVALDQAGIALGRSSGTVLRYVLGGVATLVALLACALTWGRLSATTVFACWSVGSLVVCLAGAVQLRRWIGYRYRARFDLGHVRGHLVVGLPNHVLTLTERLPALLVPLLLAHVVSPVATAYWYPAWMLAWVAYNVPIQVGLTQFAEGVRHPVAITEIVADGLRWGLLLGGAAAAGVAVLAHPLLLLVGADYAEASASALRVLALGVAPFAVWQAYSAWCRASGFVREGILSGLVLATTICALTLVAAPHGSTATAVAWVTASTAGAVWAGGRLLHERRRTLGPRVRGAHRRPRSKADLGLGIVTVLCVALAVWSATTVDLERLDDYGLARALPLGYWVGLVGLNIAFVVALSRRLAPRWLFVGLFSGLVVLVYGVSAAVSQIPRNAVSWRHIGIADALTRVGIDPHIDVYFNWPGFFSGLATFTHATGLRPVDVALWAPMAIVALWCVAIWAVLRVFTRDRTHLLLAVWLFLLGNWIDQDYLSPQALGVVLHLAVLALVMSALGATPPPVPDRLWSRAGLRTWFLEGTATPENPDRKARAAALLVALALSAALVMSHQLSPVMLVASLTALTLLRRTCVPLLPVVVGLFLLLWLTFPAYTYLNGHPLFGDDRSAVLAANVSARFSGSAGHLDILHVRTLLTVSLWGLALVGGIRSWRRGDRDLRPYVLAAVPFALLPVDSYGGEMLMRVTLFALPFVALLAARALFPLTLGPTLRPLRASALALVCVGLAVLSVAGRYGNARFDMFTAGEIRAVDALQEVAAPGSLLVAGAPSTPWAATGYEQFTRRSVESMCAADYRPDSCVSTLQEAARYEGKGGLLLLLTRGNEAALNMSGLMPAADFQRFESGIRELPGATLVFRDSDARIYRLDPSSITGSAS